MVRTEQRFVTAPDRTPIAVDVIGSGPPLVVVHGSLCQAGDWHATAHALEDDFTVLVMNRRGRSPSQDGPDYSFDREVEDVAAVVEAAGPDAVLFGHSFGGTLSLVCASVVPPQALIVYDPGVRVGGPAEAGAGTASTASLVEEALMTRGPQEALVTGMRLFAGFPDDVIAQARQSPSWQQQVDMVQTWPREIRGLEELDASPERFARISSPTLVLRGAESPQWLREAAACQARTIPGARLLDLPGQGHNANETAPQVVADSVRDFLRGLAPE